MKQEDAQTTVRTLVRSVTEGVTEEVDLTAAHLEWVLITAIERIESHEQPEETLDAAFDRGLVTCWVTPAGLSKTVVGVSDPGSAPLHVSRKAAEWPFPTSVTILGLDHCLRVAESWPGEALMTSWSFRYPDEEENMIKGVAVSARKVGERASCAEDFGRSVAAKLGWRGDDPLRSTPVRAQAGPDIR